MSFTKARPVAHKTKVKVSSKAPASRSGAKSRVVARAVPAGKTAAKSHPHGRGISIKSKSGRKPLTIKPPIRKPLPDSTVARTAKAAAVGASASKGGKGRGDSSSDGTLKGKKTRTVAEAASEHKADAKGYVFINGRRVRMISTKGQAPAKKPRSSGSANAAANAAADQAAIRAIRTKLGRKELNYYRDLLLMKRRQLVGDLNAMEDSALRSGGGNLSHMPIHMADIGTDTFDQDFTLSLAENERQQLREIDQALQRIEDGTYGVCQMTGKVIPKTRLEAKPWAKTTVEAARMIEGQWGR